MKRNRQSRQPRVEVPQISEAEKLMIRKEHPNLMIDSEETVELRIKLQQAAAKYRIRHPEDTHSISGRNLTDS